VKAPPVTKRRSIFRSPGTASSPDLATLVKKAKEARANGQVPSAAGQAAEAALQQQTMRNRATSSGMPKGDEDWEKFSSGDLKSIAESPRRNRQSSGEDSFKVGSM